MTFDPNGAHNECDHEIFVLRQEAESLRRENEVLQASLDALHGSKFSDRAYHALRSRAETAEARVKELEAREQAAVDVLKAIAVCGTDRADHGISLAISFVENLSRAKPGEGTPKEYMCVVCHNVPVDVHAGYDTCGRCASNL